MIRLHIIEDDSPIIVAGFKRLFFPQRDQIDVTGYSESVEEAILNADKTKFDIFILDLWLKNRLPIENFNKLKRKFPEKPIIIYTSEYSSQWKNTMLDEGAICYLTKNALRAELKKSIEYAYNGKTYFPSNVLEEKGKRLLINHPLGKLSPEEFEILQMIKKGYAHIEIASKFKYSISKIDKILASLRKDYNAKNTYELLNILNI